MNRPLLEQYPEIPYPYSRAIREDRRLALPKDLISTWDGSDELILTTFYRENTLLLCSDDRFAKAQEALKELNVMDSYVRRMRRNFVCEAVKVRLDSRRRIYIQKKFIALLGYDTNVNSNGIFPVVIREYGDDMIEIMSSIAYEKWLSLYTGSKR